MGYIIQLLYPKHFTTYPNFMLYERMRIYGRVQKVLFRDSARTRGNKLGLKGFVRNREDGSVEIYAAGNKEQIEKLFQWAASGPPFASVKNCERDSCELPLVCDRFYLVL